jgi:hypothetical protein
VDSLCMYRTNITIPIMQSCGHCEAVVSELRNGQPVALQFSVR